MKLNDTLHFKGTGYPDFRIVAIIDDAVALERTDNIIEPLLWYSKGYINTMLQADWELNSKE